MKFRKKPVVIEAVQWFKAGDHPLVMSLEAYAEKHGLKSPYSDFHRWLIHAFGVAENVVYLVPFGKIFKSMDTVRTIYEWAAS